MTSPMQHRTVLVTGATGGIGWAICRRLAQDGYRVALADLDAAAAQAQARLLGDGHVGLGADLTDPVVAAGLPARAAQALGRLDCVVNNAGMTDTSGRSLVDLPQDAFERLIALNLTAVERLSAAAIGLLPKGGSLVNLASGASYRPLALRGPYSATKAGIAALTKAMAQECAPLGISVSAVAPGYTRTPLVSQLEAEGRVDLAAVARAIPLGRIAEPEDIAHAVAFCASAAGRALTGRVLVVDGGSSAGTPVAGTAPAAGQGLAGADLLAGPLALLDGQAALDGPEGLSAQTALGSVIDARALAGLAPVSDQLSAARQMAQACAAHSGRTAAFSLLFVTPVGTTPAEQATSAALGMLARTLALEFAPAGLRVNCVRWDGDDTTDLASLCRFLSGAGAGIITGQSIRAGSRTAGSGQH
ncbi:SDR family oxidoreductase [Pararhodobacter zhoushanensis]|uniref:SDR family oxidoreductase n=1 Tax=Pararhodobacter zhoushanensis TaxID=2479545 RepID=UPI001C704655|nr:SDR family oxidoreductase [Pararhodobacter zhoushanensis]